MKPTAAAEAGFPGSATGFERRYSPVGGLFFGDRLTIMELPGNHGAKRDVVVIGASAGGVEVLMNLVAQLPAHFPASVFIVIHISPEFPSKLPQILARNSRLPVSHPINGQKIEPGHIYVAPSDHHLIINGGEIRLSRGPHENHVRPSIDVLFRSAAWSCGPRVTGVILTGVLDDGASGLFAVKTRGGKAVIQLPSDAPYPDLPQNVLRVVEADHCVPVIEMGALLSDMVSENIEDRRYASAEDLELEVKIALEDNALAGGVLELGAYSPFTCPECHGALMKIKEGRINRFRCHTGHAFSLNSLLVEVTKSIDNSLWSTLRTIEESELLLAHLGEHLAEAGDEAMSEIVAQKISDAKRRAQAIKQLVLNNEILSAENLRANGNGSDPSVTENP